MNSRVDEAEPLFLETIETLKRVFGDGHPNTMAAISYLGDVYIAQGRCEQAEPLLGEAVAHARRVFTSDHLTRGALIHQHGVCLTALKRYDEANASLLEAHEILTAAVGAEHASTLKAGWRAKLPETE